ncbi:MAG: zinc-binding dehydrogenase, partial [Shimia sp.]|nr:zinc-binding dehydrogenase [Shimia sp.]
EPLAVAIHAVAQAGEVAGQSVLIAGCGPIGLLTKIAAREAGADRIVMTDILANRRSVAETLGATGALDPTAENWQEALADAIGTEEVDVAFDAVGIAPTFNQTLDTVKPGGVVIALGGWLTVPVPLPRIVSKEIQVRGTFNFTVDEFKQARQWLSEQRFDPTALVTCEPTAERGRDLVHFNRQRIAEVKSAVTASISCSFCSIFSTAGMEIL